jgi:hypothetical protein
MIRIKTDSTENSNAKGSEDNQQQNITMSIRSPNQSCTIIVEVIINKVIELMEKDRTMAGLQKTMIIRTAERSKEPIKRYLLELNEEDAQDIIKKIKDILE